LGKKGGNFCFGEELEDAGSLEIFKVVESQLKKCAIVLDALAGIKL